MGSKTTEWVLKMRSDVAGQMDKISKGMGTAFDKVKKMQKAFEDNTRSTKVFGNSVDDLNKKLDALTKRRDISINVSHIEKLNRLIERTKSQMNSITTAGTTPGLFSARNFSDSISQIPGVGGLMAAGANPYLFAGSIAAAGGSFAYKSAMTNMSYDQQFAQINATAQLSPEELKKLRRDIMREGRHSTVALSTVPSAYEKILSATNDVELSKQILSASLKGSQAGFADVNDVASATVGIINTVGSKKTNATKVMDMLFASKRLGVGEFKDFANYLPSTITQGTALGYREQDVAGSFSYLTTKGYGADKSAMLLSNLFTSLSKPEVLKDLKKYGIQTYDKQGGRLDLISVFEQLDKKLGSRSQQGRDAILGDIIKDAQAKEAFNSLTKDVSTLGDIIRQTRDSAGELNKALATTANGMNEKQRLENNWEVYKDNLGSKSQPLVRGVMGWFNEALEGANEVSDVSEFSSREQQRYWSEKIMRNKRYGMPYGQDAINLGHVFGERGIGDQFQSYMHTLDMYNQITGEDIKRDPKLWGLKYKAKLGSPIDFYPDAFKKVNEDPTKPGNNKPDPALDTTLDNISGGGNIKNFTVTIHTMKAADKIVVAESEGKGYNQIGEVILEELTRAVQGLEMTAGGAQ